MCSDYEQLLAGLLQLRLKFHTNPAYQYIVLDEVEEPWRVLQFAYHCLTDDVHKYENASKGLRSNGDIVFKSVRQRGSALRYASYELRSNEEFVAECLYALSKENKTQHIKDMWHVVNIEIKEKYNDEWQPLMANYYVK